MNCRHRHERFYYALIATLTIIAFLTKSVNTQVTYVQYSDELSSSVKTRLQFLLQSASPNGVIELASNKGIDYTRLESNSVVISFGNTTQTNENISEQQLNEVGEEGFVIKTGTQINNKGEKIETISCNGNAQEKNSPFTVYQNIGLHYACYAVLEQLGFGFYHPLQPLIPPSLKFMNNSNETISEKPYWPIRGFHYHTEHPLELTECLNGMNSNTTDWQDMIGEVELYYEWLIANRQNRIEWVLLWTRDWDEFAWSPLRQQRLTILVSNAHQWGLAVGADVPIAERQQHAWFMTGPHSDLSQQTLQIMKHVDWLMAANYDYISTESGYSEFTHPNCTLMLEWMNITTEYLMSNYENKRIYIKCHCSSGQVCNQYLNPETEEPINFNFLPAFANPNLGIYAHTVQIYSFFQPAPSYGNQNFTYMLEFLLEQSDYRESLFHGETAYWVNYDIDVPLFLPVYGSNRFKDMRTIAKYEKIYNKKTLGQIDFTSGWEWAYWLGDVLTARAAWNPHMEIEDDIEAFKVALMPILNTFSNSTTTVESLTDLLINIITKEEELLIHGNWSGSLPQNIVKRNGIAYIEGWDTWAQFSSIVEPQDCVQPVKLTFENIRHHLHIFNFTNNDDNPDYASEIQPLLYSMSSNFTLFTQQLSQLSPMINEHALFLYNEIIDSMNITALRSTEVYSLYEYVWGHLHESNQWRTQQIQNANLAINQAIEVVNRREQNYRVPVNRIAGWRENPTCYHYGYLWPVHSLYYFWRDYSQATNTTIDTLFPCFMNVITPADVGFGPGILLNVTNELQDWLEEQNLDLLANCLSYPPSEPVYPETPIIDPTTSTANHPK